MAAPSKAPVPTETDRVQSDLVVAGGRLDSVVQFEAQVVDFFTGAADLLGVPKSVAVIYGIVFASAQPLSFADIAARANLSKGSVSQGLRMLREVGALKEVSTAADRAELFMPDTEMRQLIAHFLESRVEKHLDSGKRRMQGFAPSLEGYTAAEQKILRQRLQKLQRWHDRTRALLPVIRTFLKLGV